MSELAALLDSLNHQRQHVVGILEGLGEEELRRPVLPSGWSCLGLVRHLAIDDERFWFQNVVAGQRQHWEVNSWALGAQTAEEILSLYRQEIDQANEIIAGSTLDAPPKWWPEELFGQWRLHTVREVLLHVIAETACHAGHLDAACELIDGRQWVIQD